MEEHGMQVFASVWDALELSPEQAAGLRLRSDLLSALRTTIDGWEVTRAEAAHRLGLTGSRLYDIAEGRIDTFSLDDLVAVASRAGVAIRVDAAAA